MKVKMDMGRYRLRSKAANRTKRRTLKAWELAWLDSVAPVSKVEDLREVCPPYVSKRTSGLSLLNFKYQLMIMELE